MEKLRKYIRGNVYWAGEPISIGNIHCSTSIFDGVSREKPDRHGMFDTVLSIERDLGALQNWRIVLDEVLRLLAYGRHSTVLLRLAPGGGVSLPELTSFLHRRKDFSFAMIEHVEPDIIVLECLRTSSKPGLRQFGFGIISDGGRPDNIRRFTESVLQITGLDERDWQLALCGPADLRNQIPALAIDRYPKRILIIDEPSVWRKAGWITRKKNMLVDAMAAENLLIVHDRYVVAQDFLRQLDAFGADFDLLVPRQLRNGRRFPDWTATSGEWDMTKTYLLPYEADHPSLYVNGGALIAKRAILAETRWNELLFWNQAEDVELSRRLRDAGTTPRIAPLVQLEAIDARPGYERAFERTRLDGSAVPLDQAFAEGSVIDLQPLSRRQMEDKGLVVWPTHWRVTDHGLTISGHSAELVLCHVGDAPTHVRVYGTEFPPPTAMQIMVNGMVVKPELGDGFFLSLPLRNVPKAAGRQLVIAFNMAERLTITALELAGPGRTARYPVHMSSTDAAAGGMVVDGWWPLEKWGLWSRGGKSALRLSVPADMTGSPLILTMELKTLPGLPAPERLVGLSCNGMAIACLAVAGRGKNRSYTVPIKREIADRANPMLLELTVSATSTPAQTQGSDDHRDIGIGLTKLDLVRAGGVRWPLFGRLRSRRI